MKIRGLFFFICGFMLLGITPAFADPPQKEEKTLIVMGGSSLALRYATKQDAEIAFNAVLDETIVNPYLRLHVAVYDTTDQVLAAFEKGEINGVFGSPIEFMRVADKLLDETMALRYRNNGVKQSFVLIRRKDDTAVGMKDFRNRRLTLSKYQDLEALYLNTLLLRNHLPEIPRFFSERLEAKNANIAIMDVFFRKSDITIVRESEFQTAVELNPQLGKQLEVIDKSPAFLPALGSVRKSLDQDKVRSLMRDIEKVSESGKGGKILSVSQAASIVTIPREEMRSVLDLMNEYESLKRIEMQTAGSVERGAEQSGKKRHAK